MKQHLRHMNALRAFEAAGRLGRMTLAADELHVTPGAISRQVRQLEDALGVVLFEGPKNRPVLTVAGKYLQPTLSAAFMQIEQAVDAMLERQHTTLDVSCLSTFTMRWLIPRLYDFHASQPDIGVRLKATDQSAATPVSRSDVAISVVQDEDEEATPADVFLFDELLGPVLAPGLADRLRLGEPADLENREILQTRTRRNAWSMWSASVGSAVRVLPGTEFEHYYFTLEAAIGGLGICIAPWHLVMDDVRAGRLTAPLGFHASGYRYVARRNGTRDEAARLFCDWLQAQAMAMPQPGPLGARAVRPASAPRSRPPSRARRAR
ncbi:LysR substrate-binding domain-containing protein [Variovorax sp. CF313]|uniref:LysR substrate-binding domain-containing protein n=1 Tax=Variovorax sp. CF313 TaxID=1144315 RepID=UPI0005B2A0A1|nr:LysR substrate-binding domain-containing protein [Variovorax sp. CF313]